jgi:branched-chain amino acid transport system permease protein
MNSRVDLKFLAGLLVITAFLLPIFIPEAYLYIIGLSFLFAIMVASWDLMVGYTGKVNLGHTVFVGIGAYTAALLQTPSRLGIEIDIPIFASVVIGGVVASTIGFAIGVITLRLRGYYFSLVTAILPLVFMQTVFIWRDVFGGEEGFSIGMENSFAPTVAGKYYSALILMLVSVGIMLHIVNSKLGLKFKAIREDEELAESLGVDTTKYKVLAFVISSFFAGIAGSAVIHYRITVSPDLYDVPLMLLIILSAVIGGLGTMYGSVAGGVIIYLAKNWWLKEVIDLASLPINDEIVLYGILIIVGIFMPHGIYDLIKSKKPNKDSST